MQALRKIILGTAISSAALLAPCASQASDDVQLLDSLLERGLIAQADYDEQLSRLRQTYKSAVLRPLPAEQVASASAGNSGSGHEEAGHGHGGNHFEGAYVVISNEWKRGSARVDGEKITQSERAPSLGIGYTFAIDERYTLGLKATLDLKSGEFGAGDIGGNETKVLEKSHYSVAVEPGIVINDKTLVFGILAYHTAKTEIEGGTGSARLSGFGYGIGFKRSLGDHLFLMGELQHVGYGSKTVDSSTVKPSSTTGAIGLGYHF